MRVRLVGIRSGIPVVNRVLERAFPSSADAAPDSGHRDEQSGEAGDFFAWRETADEPPPSAPDH